MMQKLKIIFVGSLILSQSMGLAYAQEYKSTRPKTGPQKLGYSFGMDFGKSLKRMKPNIDLNFLLAGIQDAYLGRQLLLSQKEANKIKAEFRDRRIRQNKIKQADQCLIEQEEKKTIAKRAAKVPAYSSDMSMVDQTTARNAAWSFAILYNDIMPVFTEKNINKICQTMAVPKFDDECKSLLTKRLKFLKNNIKTIKKAIFSNPQITQNNKRGDSYRLSWDENLTSPTGEQTRNHKVLNVVLSKKIKWWIRSAYFITVPQLN